MTQKRAYKQRKEYTLRGFLFGGDRYLRTGEKWYQNFFRNKALAGKEMKRLLKKYPDAEFWIDDTTEDLKQEQEYGYR